MTDWSPLGGDPAPGDPGYLTALAADMGGMADDIVQQSSGFTALAGNIHTVWRGGTDSAAFEASVREPAPMFRALHDDLVSARSALGTYAAVLDTEQPAAAAALARAANALRRIDGAKAQLASTPAPGPFASIFQSASGSAGPVYGPPAPGLFGQGSLRLELAGAQADLASARASAEQVRGAVLGAQARAAAALTAATPSLAAWSRAYYHGGPLPAEGSLTSSAAARLFLTSYLAGHPPAFGGDASAVAGYWNSLPPDLRAAYITCSPPWSATRTGCRPSTATPRTGSTCRRPWPRCVRASPT